MGTMWNDEDIKKALKGSVPGSPSDEVAGKAWASIEGDAGSRGRASGPDWDDEELQHALKGWLPQGPSDEVSERAWVSIQAAIRDRELKGSPGLVRGPWGGTLRYAAAFLFLLVGVAVNHQVGTYRQEGKIASYLEALSDPVEEMEEGSPVRVTALLSEPLDDEALSGLIEDDEEMGTEEGTWL
jgi:hypothetical protein